MRATIPGDPVGKARPRMTKSGHTYTPTKTTQWEAAAAFVIQMAARRARWAVGRDAPLHVVIDAVKRRPKRLFRKKDPDGRIRRTTKPDGDNVAKATLDAAQRSGALVDDAQVAHLEVRSWYTARGEGPCVEIEIEVMDISEGDDRSPLLERRTRTCLSPSRSWSPDSSLIRKGSMRAGRGSSAVTFTSSTAHERRPTAKLRSK